jgi:hypothetical protein
MAFVISGTPLFGRTINNILLMVMLSGLFLASIAVGLGVVLLRHVLATRGARNVLRKDLEILAKMPESVPLVWSWRLANATPEQRQHFEIIGTGQGVHWPDIDEDISAIGMLTGTPAPPPKQKVT